LVNKNITVHDINETTRFWVCQPCYKSRNSAGTISGLGSTKAGYLTSCPLPYKRTLLHMHPLKTQMLSILDVTIFFAKRLSTFAKGGISNAASLVSPLIDYTSQLPAIAYNITQDLLDILAVQKIANPIIRNYKTNLERPNPTTGFPVCSEHDVRHITEHARNRDPRVQLGFNLEPTPRHSGLAQLLPQGSSMLHEKVRPNSNPVAARSLLGNIHPRWEPVEIDEGVAFMCTPFF